MFKLPFVHEHDLNSIRSSKLYDNNTFYNAFMRDLSTSRKCVYIESPFITSKRVNQLLPVFAKLARRGIKVIINTRQPEEHDGEYIGQAHHAIMSMQDLGISVLYTGRLHRKIAVVDDILWEGSLNILSYSDSCEIMRRMDSATLVDEMLRFVKVSHYVA